MKKKDVFISILGIPISILLIYLTFKDFNFNSVIPIVKNIKIYFFLLFLISTFWEIFFRTLKWYLIILPSKKTDFKELFKFEIISLGINNILPFRMGEISKMFLLSQKYSLSKTTAISTVFVERILDTFILFGSFLIYSSLGNINIGIRKENIILILIVLSVMIFLIFIYIDKIIELKTFSDIEKNHPKIHQILIKIRKGGICFKNPRLTFLILLSGLIQWNFDVLNNFIIAKAMKIDLDYFKAAITVFAGSVSASIPSMPGYFGNYEYAISRVMILWGVDRNISVIFPSLIHILSYSIITSCAIVLIYKEKETMINIFKKIRKD